MASAKPAGPLPTWLGTNPNEKKEDQVTTLMSNPILASESASSHRQGRRGGRTSGPIWNEVTAVDATRRCPDPSSSLAIQGRGIWTLHA